MDKPKMKQNVGIFIKSKANGFIVFDASSEIADAIKDLGRLEKQNNIISPNFSRYHFDIDTRYDFDEVQAYLLSFNKNTKDAEANATDFVILPDTGFEKFKK